MIQYCSGSLFPMFFSSSCYVCMKDDINLFRRGPSMVELIMFCFILLSCLSKTVILYTCRATPYNEN